LPPLEKTTPLAEPSNATSSVPPLIVVATAAVPGAYLAAATRAKRLNDGPMLEALKGLNGETIYGILHPRATSSLASTSPPWARSAKGSSSSTSMRCASGKRMPGGAEAALAAKAATATTPIVFGTGGDPVAFGLVASLNRPGANLTGIVNFAGELAPKRLQLLRELIPNAVVFGVVEDPTVKAYPSIIADLQAAALTLGLQLVIVNASSDSDVERAFASLSQQRVRAVLIGVSNLYLRRMEQLASLAARHALPTMFTYREFVLAGGLMSYGSSLGYAYHQVGTYTGRILKGEKPADLPVEQAMRLELTINLKTAKALGLTIPETLLATADEVIQ